MLEALRHGYSFHRRMKAENAGAGRARGAVPPLAAAALAPLPAALADDALESRLAARNCGGRVIRPGAPAASLPYVFGP